MRERRLGAEVHISRTANHLSISNAWMLLFLPLSKLKETGIVTFDLELSNILCRVWEPHILGWRDVNLAKEDSAESGETFRLNPK